MSVIDTIKFVDIEISTNDDEKDISIVIHEIRPGWKLEDLRFKKFTKGITNKLVGCYNAQDLERKDMVLVRIYGEQSDIMVDREMEIKSMLLVHQAGCGAELYCRFRNGLAYEYVHGECVDVVSVRDPKVSRAIAQEMVTIHSIDLDKATVNGVKVHIKKKTSLFDVCKDWIANIPDNFSSEEANKRSKELKIPSKKQLEEEFDMINAELAGLDLPTTFCHNDPVPNNILYNKHTGKATFIDFEYAGLNYEAYDIGAHFAEYCGVQDIDISQYPDKAYQYEWLRTYLELKKESMAKNQNQTSVHESEVENLYVQVNKCAMACHFIVCVWALVQCGVSTIDFDYLDFAATRLSGYFGKKEEFMKLKLT